MKTYIELNYRSGLPFLLEVDAIHSVIPDSPETNKSGCRLYLKSEMGSEGYTRVSNSYDEIKTKLGYK